MTLVAEGGTHGQAVRASARRTRGRSDHTGLLRALVIALVGTVDKIQGREAPVVIVSLAAPSAEDVPCGMDVLLSRHRLNVAVSRGQWAAFVVHCPARTPITFPQRRRALNSSARTYRCSIIH